MNFSDLGLDSLFDRILNELKIQEPTKVQENAIPEILSLSAKNDNRNKLLIMESETGTGKTLAYLLPILETIRNKEPGNPFVLVCLPTKELASQIKTHLDLVTSKFVKPIKSILLIGDTPMKRQIERLKEKPFFVIGTVGRIQELIHLKKLKPESLGFLVLDEVDRLFSKEMREETENLRKFLPENLMTIAVSATLNRNLEEKLVEFLEIERENLKEVRLPVEDILKKKITHWAFYAQRRDKIPLLRSIIYALNPEKALVFTGESGQVENIVSQLVYKKVRNVAGLNAKMDKFSKQEILRDYKKGKIKILVTSDLSARGLDIPDITHVIQMDIPQSQDFFIHRAGRTGRAGKTGINILIGDRGEMFRLKNFEKNLEIRICPKMLYNGNIEEIPEEEAAGENDFDTRDEYSPAPRHKKGRKAFPETKEATVRKNNISAGKKGKQRHSPDSISDVSSQFQNKGAEKSHNRFGNKNRKPSQKKHSAKQGEKQASASKHTGMKSEAETGKRLKNTSKGSAKKTPDNKDKTTVENGLPVPFYAGIYSPKKHKKMAKKGKKV